MSKLTAFADELEKIAASRIPASVLLGAGGAAVGAKRGFSGALAEQHKDDTRLKKGLISRTEWRKRRDLRVAKGLATTVGWGTAGAMVPRGADRVRRFFISGVQDASPSIGQSISKGLKESSDYVEKRYTKALKDQVDYAMSQAPKAARKAGEEFAEGVHDISSTKKDPLFSIKVDPANLPPWMQKLFGGG